jgi:hypothetical protein
LTPDQITDTPSIAPPTIGSLSAHSGAEVLTLGHLMSFGGYELDAISALWWSSVLNLLLRNRQVAHSRADMGIRLA